MRDFNLLPESVIIEKKTRGNDRIAIYIMTGMVGFVLLITAFWLVITTVEQKKVDNLTNRIEKIKPVAELRSDLDSMEKSMKDKRIVKKFIGDQERTIINELSFIEEIINKDMTVTTVSLNSSEVGMSCIAKDKETVAKFLNKLRNNDNFQTTFIPSLSEEGSSDEAAKDNAESKSSDKSRKFEVKLKVKSNEFKK